MRRSDADVRLPACVAEPIGGKFMTVDERRNNDFKLDPGNRFVCFPLARLLMFSFCLLQSKTVPSCAGVERPNRREIPVPKPAKMVGRNATTPAAPDGGKMKCLQH